MSETHHLLKQLSPVTFKSKELVKHLPENEQKAVFELIEASKLCTNIFLEQASHDGLPAIRETEKQLNEAKAKQNSQKVKELEQLLYMLHLFAGPYAIPTGENFLPGQTGTTPLEAGFYPKGTTKEQIEAYIEKHPEQKESLLAIDTIVESDGNGGYKAVPMSERYSEFVKPMCAHLNSAADLFEPTQPELARFIRHRSDALGNNKSLYDTDVEWMNLPATCPIDIVIGPIETYEDQIEGAKGSYECIIFVRDEGETAKLQRFRGLMDQMEMVLPLPEQYRQKKGTIKYSESSTESANSSSAPAGQSTETRIELYNVVHLGGSSASPMFTMAHNLPNDERITAQYGNRNQFYLNVINAKMETILRPLSEVILAPQHRKHLSADAFFLHTLLHELSHTLGPSFVRNDPTQNTCKQALTDLYSSLEECKADTVGHFFAQCVADGVVKENSTDEQVKLVSEEELACIRTTDFVSMFRSIRFGTSSAHARGSLIQLNWLLTHGVAVPPEDPSAYGFTLNLDKWTEAATGLSEELLAIKITGDRPRAEKLIKEYGTVVPECIKHHLDGLKDLPIDLRVSFDV